MDLQGWGFLVTCIVTGLTTIYGLYIKLRQDENKTKAAQLEVRLAEKTEECREERRQHLTLLEYRQRSIDELCEINTQYRVDEAELYAQLRLFHAMVVRLVEHSKTKERVPDLPERRTRPEMKERSEFIRAETKFSTELKAEAMRAEISSDGKGPGAR